jgi:hypothetical protein
MNGESFRQAVGGVEDTIENPGQDLGAIVLEALREGGREGGKVSGRSRGHGTKSEKGLQYRRIGGTEGGREGGREGG